MLAIIFLIVLFLGTLWYYVKSFKHPKGFPPGPRLSLPIMGDAYILGEDFAFGFSSLIRKYGKTVGLWLGSNRAVAISDFDTLKEILNLTEASDRGGLVETETEGTYATQIITYCTLTLPMF